MEHLFPSMSNLHGIARGELSLSSAYPIRHESEISLIPESLKFFRVIGLEICCGVGMGGGGGPVEFSLEKRGKGGKRKRGGWVVCFEASRWGNIIIDFPEGY